MRKKILLIVFAFLFIFAVFFAINSKPSSKKTSVLKIYTYDSLAVEWGLLPAVLPEFEKKYKIKTEVVSFADTGQMLSKLIFEKNNPQADIVVGLDNVSFAQVGKYDLTVPYRPRNYEKIEKSLWFDDKFSLTPFDYGFVGFVYDSEKINFNKPISLMDLTKPQYKDQIIIQQAGLSSPGTQLMLWTKAALSQEQDKIFWQKMSENVLTVSPDWSTAYYSMFLEGEAPVVLSYLTSPAYHIEQEKTDRYKAIVIKEGYIRQVEGAGIVRGVDNIEAAKQFIDFMISPFVQSKIATTQWMFPVLRSPDYLPKSYDKIIRPKENETLSISKDISEKNYQKWLGQWNKIFKIE